MRVLALLISASAIALLLWMRPVSPPNGDETARSGCCSWHHGVCGCSGGRALCCDGTL